MKLMPNHDGFKLFEDFFFWYVLDFNLHLSEFYIHYPTHSHLFYILRILIYPHLNAAMYKGRK